MLVDQVGVLDLTLRLIMLERKSAQLVCVNLLGFAHYLLLSPKRL